VGKSPLLQETDANVYTAKRVPNPNAHGPNRPQLQPSPPSFGQREPWAIEAMGKGASGRIGLWVKRPVGNEVHG